MQKMSGRICDYCRIMFYPEDHVVELCHKCAHTVWCVMNVYEDGSRELSSIHRNPMSANDQKNSNLKMIKELNQDRDVKLVKQEVTSWCVL